MAQIQSQIRLHIDSATQNLIPRLAARLGSNSARLSSLGVARLSADDVAADWTLTWHANCACWCHAYAMMTSSLSGSGPWVGSSGIRVGSAHPSEEDACDAWRASVRVGSTLVGA